MRPSIGFQLYKTCDMTQREVFRHQSYTSETPIASYEMHAPTELWEVDSADFRAVLSAARESLARQNVKTIYLVHGTFSGDDFAGFFGEWERYAPSKARRWRTELKRFVDAASGELGNYTEDFARRLAGNESPTEALPIPVRLFHWSGENHHFARIDAAIRLLDELYSQPFDTGRIMIWGHSHGGNVMALVSNLLAANEASLREFLKATGYSRNKQDRGEWDRPVWKRVLDKLTGGRETIGNSSLDLVTFGNPIRYGWCLDERDTLTHFVNHRPTEGGREYLANRPQSLHDIRSATAGDMVHQLGIAGSNCLPSLFAWKNWSTERRLRRFLEPGMRRRSYWKSLATGMRLAEDGVTLLVDYSRADAILARQILGHAVYTTSRWLPFHAQTVANQIAKAETE